MFLPTIVETFFDVIGCGHTGVSTGPITPRTYEVHTESTEMTPYIFGCSLARHIDRSSRADVGKSGE